MSRMGELTVAAILAGANANLEADEILLRRWRLDSPWEGQPPWVGCCATDGCEYNAQPDDVYCLVCQSAWNELMDRMIREAWAA